MTDPAVDTVWSVADAKARFSELLDRATTEGPHAISRRGREVAMVVSIEEWHRKAQRSGSLAEFLATSPLRDSGLHVDRMEAAPRDIPL